MPYRRFLAFNVFGGALWVLSMTLIGYFLGQIPGVKEHIEVVINDAVLGVTHELDSPLKQGDRITLLGQFMGG